MLRNCWTLHFSVLPTKEHFTIEPKSQMTNAQTGLRPSTLPTQVFCAHNSFVNWYRSLEDEGITVQSVIFCCSISSPLPWDFTVILQQRPRTIAGFRSRSRGIWLEPEPGYLAGAGAVTLARLHLKYLFNNSRKLH